jgi:hypothetical protein
MRTDRKEALVSDVLTSPPTRILTPGHPGWNNARRAWNLTVDQQPAAVALPDCAQDVVATPSVSLARTACGSPRREPVTTPGRQTPPHPFPTHPPTRKTRSHGRHTEHGFRDQQVVGEVEVLQASAGEPLEDLAIALHHGLKARPESLVLPLALDVICDRFAHSV